MEMNRTKGKGPVLAVGTYLSTDANSCGRRRELLQCLELSIIWDHNGRPD